eukprot:scaffold2069_cov187-Amphora_coffeaeformis.AAC.10
MTIQIQKEDNLLGTNSSSSQRVESSFCRYMKWLPPYHTHDKTISEHQGGIDSLHSRPSLVSPVFVSLAWFPHLSRGRVGTLLYASKRPSG